MMSSGNYENGTKTSKWLSYYRDGNLLSVINYENGLNIRYYQNGQREMEGLVIDGKKIAFGTIGTMMGK